MPSPAEIAGRMNQGEVNALTRSARHNKPFRTQYRNHLVALGIVADTGRIALGQSVVIITDLGRAVAAELAVP